MEYSINEIERLKNEINSLKIENKVGCIQQRKQPIFLY